MQSTEMMIPCKDHCYIRFGKQYTEDCDTRCDYAKAVKESQQLRSEVVKLTEERDRAVGCIYGVQTALENGDPKDAMEEIIAYNATINEDRSDGSMNRAQRRATDKKLRSVKGYNLYKKLLEESMKLSATEDMLEDGEQVKINVEQIMGREEWNKLNSDYQAFVQQNRDTVFTARIRRRSPGGYPVIVDLDEFDTWSFWSGDLIRLKKKKE